ncbi:MAG: ATP synthase F1 subunit delta [Chitinophagaceae bacterium]
MQNPRLASRYAKSLVDIALQTNILEEIYQDMLLLQTVCKNSRDFLTMLKSPIVNGDKKQKIFHALFSGKVQSLTEKFSDLLIRKGREPFLPEIVEAFIGQYLIIKQIKTVKIKTAIPIDKDLSEVITSRIQLTTPLSYIQLEQEVNEALIGGFVLEMEGILFDASIQRDLMDIRKDFMENNFVPKI